MNDNIIDPKFLVIRRAIMEIRPNHELLESHCGVLGGPENNIIIRHNLIPVYPVLNYTVGNALSIHDIIHL